MVRSDPVEQIRNVLEQVAAARGLTQVHNEQSYGKSQKPTRHQKYRTRALQDPCKGVGGSSLNFRFDL